LSGPNPPGPDSPTPDEPPRETPPPTGEARTGETEIYSQAYSAPEAEQFTSGPYVPADSSLYDYDSYDAPSELVDQQPPRWPWVVGVIAIVAAVALVASVAVLVTRTDNTNLATPSTSTTTPGAPVQDEITSTTPPSSEPPTPSSAEPPPPPPETVTITEEPPPPQPEPTEGPPPPPTAAPPSSAPAGPRFITYSVTGTKAPLDRISVTYTDASGRQRTQQNVYIPWSLTVTPISMSEYGSVQASSLLRLSKLNCSITTSDGQTIASQQNNDWQTSC